jgi:hypothetical protein
VSTQENLLASHDYAIFSGATIAAAPWLKTLPLRRLVPRELPGDVEKMPALLALKPLTEPYIAYLSENLEDAEAGVMPHLISGLITVTPDTTPEAIEKHLTSRIVLNSPQGKVYLRYFDPRVFIHLHRILDINKVRTLYGPIQTWTITFQKRWISLPAPDDGPKLLSWGVTTPQRKRLDDVGLINRALLVYSRERGWPLSRQDEFDMATRIAEEAITRARNYKLKDKDDLIAFAAHTLAHGNRFDMHPRIQSLLGAARRGEVSYAGAAIFDEQEWAEINANDELSSQEKG